MCGLSYTEGFEDPDCVQSLLDIGESHGEYRRSSVESDDENVLRVVVVDDALGILESERELAYAEASLDRPIVRVEQGLVGILRISMVLVMSEADEWVQSEQENVSLVPELVAHPEIPSALLREEAHRHVATGIRIERVGVLSLEQFELRFVHNFWRNHIIMLYTIAMSKRQLLILLGIWVMVFTFLGFPPAWKQVFAVAAGAIIVTIAVASKPKERPQPNKSAVPFVEHKTMDMRAPSESITKTDQSMNA